MTFQGHLGTVNGFIVRISNIQHIMYGDGVNYNGRTSYVSNYFHCRIRPEGLLCDVERDLLPIAKFTVLNVVTKMKDCSRPRAS